MKVVTISLHGGGSIRVRGDYELDLDEDGRVVVTVGKARHVTNWTSIKRLHDKIYAKRKVRATDIDEVE